MPTVTTEQTALALVGGQLGQLDPAVKRQAYLAAEAYVEDRCTWGSAPVGGAVPSVPDALVQAVVLLTARYLERRDTPSGVLGSGDFGVVRVSGSDRDVDALISPWRKRVMG